MFQNADKLTSNVALGGLVVFGLLYIVLPYDTFYTPNGTLKAAESGKAPYSVDSTDIRTKYHAVNEMGMILNRVENEESHQRQIKEDSNRAEQFINTVSGMTKQVLTDKSHNGKSALDIMATGPLGAASGLSDILSGVPVGESPNQEAKEEFKRNTAKAFEGVDSANVSDQPFSQQSDMSDFER